MLRHQLAMATVLPKPDEAGRASAARQFEIFIDQMAEMLAGKEPPATDDPAIEKLRKLH